MDFFRFPHTPHLGWLGEVQPRQDKVLSADEVAELLGHEVIVEEKVDGANIGFSLDENGSLRIQNRGGFLSRDSAHPQFAPLFRWIEPRRAALVEVLTADIILFGEWCYAQHSVPYSNLPDWFLAFDVYDRVQGEFWTTVRRDELAAGLGLALIPRLASGRFDLPQLEKLLGPSRVGDGPAEGLYVRREEGLWLKTRAKLVRKEFVQAIGEHWSRRSLTPNTVSGALAHTPGEMISPSYSQREREAMPTQDEDKTKSSRTPRARTLSS